MNMDRYIIIAGLLFIALVLSFFMPIYYAFAIISGLILVAVLIGSPRTVVFLYMMIILIHPLLYGNIQHPLIKHTNKVVGLALFTVWFGQVAFRRIAVEKRDLFTKLAVSMSIYVVFVWFLNRGPIRAFAQAVLVYFSFIPLFLVGREFLRKEDFFIFLKAGIGTLWVGFILNMGWRFGVNPMANFHHSTGNLTDSWIGIFELCNIYAYFCSIFFILIMAVLSAPDLRLSRGLRRSLYLSLPILLFELYFTYTNHAYAIFAVALIPFLSITGLWKRWYVITIVLLIAVVVFVTYSSSEQLQLQFNTENLTYRTERLYYSAKMQLYNKVFVQNLNDRPMEWVFGVGPGDGVGVLGKDNLTDYALRMLLGFYQRDSVHLREMQMTSISGLTDAGYVTLWGDYGMLGTPIYLGIYAWLFINCVRVFRDKKLDPIRCVIAQFLIGAITYIFLLNFLIDTFVRPVWAVIIWGMGALLFGTKASEPSLTNDVECDDEG